MFLKLADANIYKKRITDKSGYYFFQRAEMGKPPARGENSSPMAF